jgi:hypothetical protein
VTFGFDEKFAIRALMRHPPSDSTRVVVGVDLNHFLAICKVDRFIEGRGPLLQKRFEVG